VVTGRVPHQRSDSQYPLEAAMSGWFSANAWQKAAQDALRTVTDDLQEFRKAVQEDTGEVVSVVKQKAPEVQAQLQETLKTKAPEIQKKSQEVAADVQRNFATVTEQVASFSQSIVTGTGEIFQQVQEAVAMEMETKKQKKTRERKARTTRDPSIGTGAKYSRYESQVSAIQRDSGTYCDEPADKEDFENWVSTFKISDHQSAIEEVLKDNAFMQELQSRIVPLIVDQDTFWTRYFYRLSKLQQQHDQRTLLVQRAAKVEEEELSWDVDDGEEATGATEAEAEDRAQSAGEPGGEAEEAAEAAEAEADAVAEAVEQVQISDVAQAPPAAPPVEPSSAPVAEGEDGENSDDTTTSTDFVVVKSPTEPRSPAPASETPASGSASTKAEKDPSSGKEKKSAVSPPEEEEIEEDWGEDVDEDWGNN